MHTTHDFVQGSPEWHANRATSNNASEAGAALGVSPYLSRDDLIRQIATGYRPEIDEHTERRFADGHRFERLARPLAEAIIGEELYPASVSIVVDGLARPLAASLDGTTMDETTNWEHKTLNADLAAALKIGVIPEQYHPQMEQGMLINGATRCLFMATRWDDDDQLIEEAHCWYEWRPDLRARLIPAWWQVEAEAATYRHVEVLPPAVAAPIEDLPVLSVEISGRVVASNLTQWHDVVTARIKGISTALHTDTDFATAEKTVKFLEDGEKRIALIKSQAQAQATDIDAVFRAMDNIAAEMRAKRLELDKLVKARKESIRGEIMQEGKDALAAHLAALNKRLAGRVQMPPIQADLAGAMKGRKTVASLREAVNGELARAKIEASALADKIDANLKALDEHNDYAFLFADLARIVVKDADDLAALIRTRIADHQAAEEKKEAELRERVRKEEEAKAAAAIAAAVKESAQATVVQQNGASSTPGHSAELLSPAEAVAQKPAAVGVSAPTAAASVAKARRPTDDQIIDVLSLHYRVHESTVIAWLCDIDLTAASNRMAAQFAA